MLLFGPGIRHVPEHVWRSGYFWIMMIVVIVGILIYHNYFRNMKNGNFFSKLFGFSSAGPGGVKIWYDKQGRSGYVWYQSPETKFSMYYELGGGDCLFGLSVPSPQDWEKITGLPVERREEVLQYVGRQVIRDEANNGSATFKIEGNWLNIYS